MTVSSALHSKNKKYFQIPFLVLQLVINRGLGSEPGKNAISTWKDHDRNLRNLLYRIEMHS